MSQAPTEINPMSLSLEQLNSLKTSHEEEIAELNRQLEALYGAKGRFVNSRGTLDDITTSSSAGSSLLVPLTSSLYVPGTIADTEKVIVELGTGYFCEKTIPAAQDMIDRKVALINASIDTIEATANQKRKNVEVFHQVMQIKLAMLQQSQSQSAATTK